ncbi:hypothetical protein B566_EDAN009549 [Ephemera danica]|nr:hypothetical protein B566_EDAN009549 [Ephemera danica]
MVSSTQANLRSLAVAAAAGRPVLLQGPVGCGKTALVEYLAALTGPPDLLKVQLGDETDSKMLLGAYCCTEVPGEFIWQPGVLTQAIQRGAWLLLEDIDCAGMDVISVLASLIETNALSVPGYRDCVRAAPTFQLFATQRLTQGSAGFHRSHSSPSAVLDDLWLQLSVEPLARHELNAIIESKFPALAPVASRLLDVFLLFSQGSHAMALESAPLSRAATGMDEAPQPATSGPVGRLISTRDLMKWCSRVVQGFDGSSPDCALRILQDAIDLFCCSSSSPEETKQQAIAVAGRLGIVSTKADFYCSQYKPTITISPTKVQYCSVFPDESSQLSAGASRMLCSSFRACVAGGRQNCDGAAAGSESWETSQSPQYEPTQFKPVDLKLVIGPVREEFEQLFYRMERLESQLKAGHASLAFSFIEGALKLLMLSFTGQVRAVVTGEWVLLDEINLASAETLQCLSGLLEGSTGSLHLLERGDEKPITRHPDFRLFACMNPATDVGKKDLPPGLRNRFTELFVEELSDKTDLIQLAACYLGGLGIKASRLDSLVKLYLQLRIEANKNLASGTGHKPHFSLRTFCRALSVAASNPCGSVSRSLLEAFNLSFLTQLDRPSQQVVEELIIKAVCGKESKSILNQPLPEPSSGGYNKVEAFWVQQGEEEVHIPDKYILTRSVRGHLKALARAVSLGRAPVLLQGETSVGKTSLVSYLAQITGHRCLRINNHEHTDLQEYLGALVEAMRKGHWVILDELNLAPSDVLEALNRVLDDNRELFIPETQTLVQAHPRFMLFATQNPPGLYGGRKLLSRAFRNRFVELHFGEIPSNELEIILQDRCALPASYAKKMVAVMGELQIRRRGSAAFAGKQGFMTLRDLFRWGERVRRAEEALVIQEAIKKHLRLNSNTSAATKDILEVVTKASLPGFEHIVWTFNMRRLAVLVGKAVQFSEPALLVGETGCGKTSVCQLLAALRGHSLLSVNCHMHTEAADFLGSLRPVRDHQDKDHLFEWLDGPLVQAMSNGDWFLADEISLADDSVLERLNSLLEPERSLLLAEKGGECTVTAEPSFQFVATMNPGGDFGKKELSPALRNRLTEVWCEGCESQADRVAVVERSVRPGLALGNQQDATSGIGHCSAAFVTWLQATELGSRLTVSVRDLLTWVHFINVVSEQDSTGQTTALDLGSAYVHGACLTFLDSLGSGVTSGASGATVAAARKAAIQFLNEQIIRETGQPPDYNPLADKACKIHTSDRYFGMKPFFIEKGMRENSDGTYKRQRQDGKSGMPNNFLFEAPSTCISVLRLLRALQLSKPVLLEGSPGVGKTSLVHAVANAAGHSITRINLSDQTDASDLFGADLPVEGGVGGQFAWRDGPFLQALKAGHWIVLDELNLASQSVLEALNACLDHRGEVYIPELGRSFQVHAKSTRLFACQNPQRQGGARRGLPRSFLNRFTQVYIEALTPSDLKFIASSSFPDLPQPLLSQMVSFSCRVAHETGELRTWGSRGGPWEMNLRDLSRWAMAARVTEDCNLGPEAAAKLIYVERMRTQEDRMQMAQVFEEEVKPLPAGLPRVSVTPEYLKVGGVRLPRGDHCQVESARELLLLRSSLPTLHALATCVHHNWLTILCVSAGWTRGPSIARPCCELGHGHDGDTGWLRAGRTQFLYFPSRFAAEYKWNPA